jgi:hypothetical protein
MGYNSNPKERRTKDGNKRRIGEWKTHVPADWATADAELVTRLIAKVAADGGALRFGYTRDGGAYALGIYGDGDPYTIYLPPDGDLDGWLRAVLEAWVQA